MANLGVILTDAAAWVWSLDGPPAPWLRLDASADDSESDVPAT